MAFCLFFVQKTWLYEFFGKIYWQRYCEDRIVCWQEKTICFPSILSLFSSCLSTKTQSSLLTPLLNEMTKCNDWYWVFDADSYVAFFIPNSYDLASSDSNASISWHAIPTLHKPLRCTNTFYHHITVVLLTVVTCAANGISHLINC